MDEEQYKRDRAKTIQIVECISKEFYEKKVPTGIALAALSILSANVLVHIEEESDADVTSDFIESIEMQKKKIRTRSLRNLKIDLD